MCTALSIGELLPFLGPMKLWVIALQENMAQQIFALLIISFIPYSCLWAFECTQPLFVSILNGGVAFLKAFSKVSLSSTQEVPTCACNSVKVVVIRTVLTNFCLYYVSLLYSYAKRFHHPSRLPNTG